jgi:hypothetical protein
MKKLELEFRNEFKKADDGFQVGKMKIVMTPPLNEDYWVFRVKLHADQAVVAFPKFGTLGIGFAIEDDWNTNLPYQCTTTEILEHIWHNHKYDEITKPMLRKAIDILQRASKYYKENELTEQTYCNEKKFVKYVEKMEAFIGIKS